MANSSDQGVGLVTKRVFESSSFQLLSGRTIRDVRLGYETFGTLNASGDNAVLITHYFSGTSHCAGRYSEADLEPGYWDSLIGPGRAIDTDRFFVVSVDSLCNVNARDPRVVTTGPASIDPDTGVPYALRFPLISIHDLVHAQHVVLRSLGVRSLHAVCGPSMGAMQALAWATVFPDMVQRVLAAIPSRIESDPYLIARVGSWIAPILRDPNWNRGSYYQGLPPEAGLADAFRLITLDALHYEWADRTFGRRRQDPDRDPAASLENHFAIESSINELAHTRARVSDANSLLYIAKAVQTFSIRSDLEKIRARVLCLPARSDLLLYPSYAASTATALREAGVQVESLTLDGGGGHLDGLHVIAQAASTIRRFLDV